MSPLTAKLSLELRAHGSITSPHSFYIGTLGDIGLGGLLYTLAPLAFFTLWLPLSNRGPFTLACAAVSLATLIGGLSEALDAAAPGSTWFFLALFWMGHCLQGQVTESLDTVHEQAEPTPVGGVAGAGDLGRMGGIR